MKRPPGILALSEWELDEMLLLRRRGWTNFELAASARKASSGTASAQEPTHAPLRAKWTNCPRRAFAWLLRPLQRPTGASNTKGDRHVSEYKPITGELRNMPQRYDNFANVEKVVFNGEDFDRLCDAIDSIHAALEAECEQYRDGWVELPKDAYDEHIFAEDKLDGYGKTIEVVELRYGRSGWVLISRDGNAYADTFAFTHHHATTVEDVLAEMFAKAIERGELTNGARRTIAEYAKRLTLVGDSE